MTEYQQSICRKTIAPKKLRPIVLNQGKKQLEESSEKPMFKLSKYVQYPFIHSHFYEEIHPCVITAKFIIFSLQV